jgi:hypothetical protein
LEAGAVASTALVASASLAEEALAAAPIPQGDIYILRLLAAAEILETDLWVQYNSFAESRTTKSQAATATRRSPKRSTISTRT